MKTINEQKNQDVFHIVVPKALKHFLLQQSSTNSIKILEILTVAFCISLKSSYASGLSEMNDVI